MDRILPLLADADPGVYLVDAEGALRQVHAHQGGEYALIDIVEFFELGTTIEELAVDIVEFDRVELRALKAMADSCRDDYPAEFITMCYDVYEEAIGVSGDLVRFYGNF
jgi:hypothetical protein